MRKGRGFGSKQGIRRGMGTGQGSGYRNLIPRDRPVHQMSGKGIKQPQLKLAQFGLRQRKLNTLQVIGHKPEPLKNLTFKQLKRRGVFLRYQADADKDGVPNIRDCRPLNAKKQGGRHFWSALEARGITIVGSPQERKVMRQVFEKRPELLSKAAGVTIHVSDIGSAYVLPQNRVAAGFEPLFGQEHIEIERKLFHDILKKKTVPQFPRKNIDTLGSILAHELKHRQQAHTDFQKFKSASTAMDRRLEMGIIGARDYSKQPLEKEACNEMLRKRERDIQVPMRQQLKTFKQVIR